MTFPSKMAPFQKIIYRKGDTFGEWSVRHLEELFLPYREPNYSLVSIIHLMMNRLGQSYETLMKMDQEKRDELFNIELDIMKKEQDANKQK